LSAPELTYRAPLARRVGDRRRAALRAALTVVIVLAALAAAWIVGRRSAGQRDNVYPPSRLAIVAPLIGGTGAASVQRQLALSPDGGTLLYVAVTPDGRNELVRQSLVAPEPTPIPGVRKGTAAPVISADGQSFVGWVMG